LYIISLNFNFVVLWVRRSFTGLSPERPAFDPRLFHVGFVVGKVALEHVFAPSVMPLTLNAHLYLHVASQKDKQTKPAVPEQGTVG